ncbi:MAG: GNAT family N-acetyltransferase [Candidatus Heimdallarchaeota archaeon]|nr:GNAT family N-acetyltransferase [Candidatus Heimdallarchaeota archaeon]
MLIHQAEVNNLPAIITLWQQSGLPIRPCGRDKLENLESQLKQSNMWIIIAEENEEIIGAVLVTHDSRKGWINRLAVHPNMTRRGIATRLLKEAEESLVKNGIEIFAALISDDNISSRRLFEKENYQYHKTITYYSKRFRDDI